MNTWALGWEHPTEWSISPLTVIFRPVGLPIPKKLKDVLAQLHDRAEEGGEDE